ncbi:MAG: hypothetical protein ACWA42_09405 [Lutibacter sp.]
MQNYRLNIVLLLLSTSLFAQKIKKDTLKTEEITVTKTYTPTITDAQKIQLSDTIFSQKKDSIKKLNYSVKNFPVASTFTPSKGKVLGIPRNKKSTNFNNYIAIGYGNYNSPFLKSFIGNTDSRNYKYGLFINYQSSLANIKNTLLNSDYSNTNISGFYKENQRYLDYKIKATLSRLKVNYYGLPALTSISQALIESLNEKQVYKNVQLDGTLNLKSSILSESKIKLYHFTDSYHSSEYNIKLNPVIKFPLATEEIINPFSIEYLKGKFENNYQNNAAINYQFFNIGMQPSLMVIRDKFRFNLGVNLLLNNNLESNSNQFYAYPNIKLSYKLSQELSFQTGIDGQFTQNNYQQYTLENPYVAPTLNILPSNRKYNAFLQLTHQQNGINLKVKTNYKNTENKPLFILNQSLTNGNNLISNAYQAGNSFKVIYDNIKTLSVLGEIEGDISPNIAFSGQVIYSHFTTSNELKAWNLPQLKGSAKLQYQSKSWKTAAEITYYGKTYDFQIPYNQTASNGQIIENKGFFNVQLNLSYQFSKSLAAFEKINNVLNTSYNQFANYNLQKFQFTAGVRYQFNW